MEISSNLTLELFNQPFLLEKRIELLFAIQKVGSINKAAKEVPMSYKSAWEAVDAMNNLSHTPILTKVTGGAGGGGTKLTAYGENLLETYTLLKEEQNKFLQSLKKRTNINTGTLQTIGRLAIQISARNQIQGIISQINKLTVNAEIHLKLKSGNTLISYITNNSLDALNLKVHDEVTAIFKSSSVSLSDEKDHQNKHQNVFKGSVKQMHKGEGTAEVILNIGQEETIVSIITEAQLQTLTLQLGKEITAVIDASDIMIGR